MVSYLRLVQDYDIFSLISANVPFLDRRTSYRGTYQLFWL